MLRFSFWNAADLSVLFDDFWQRQTHEDSENQSFPRMSSQLLSQAIPALNPWSQLLPDCFLQGLIWCSRTCLQWLIRNELRVWPGAFATVVCCCCLLLGICLGFDPGRQAGATTWSHFFPYVTRPEWVSARSPASEPSVRGHSGKQCRARLPPEVWCGALSLPEPLCGASMGQENLRGEGRTHCTHVAWDPPASSLGRGCPSPWQGPLLFQPNVSRGNNHKETLFYM